MSRVPPKVKQVNKTMNPIEHQQYPYSLNVNGHIVELDCPKVMGILNVTPDSFYAKSRNQSVGEVEARCKQIVDEGGEMIDVGAYSSRPGADDVPAEEEMSRLRMALPIVERAAPGAIVSVDTFRADVAKMCVEEYGVGIINDISGGDIDSRMFKTVARLGVPYVLMHMQGTPQTMQDCPEYGDVVSEVMQYLSLRVARLRDLGAKDIILDPGFGFGKTVGQNFALLARLDDFQEFGLPVLAGVSRKSMIYKPLNCTAQEALNGTTVLNTIALAKGCSILRVHDVKQASEAVKLFCLMKKNIEGNKNSVGRNK